MWMQRLVMAFGVMVAIVILVLNHAAGPSTPVAASLAEPVTLSPGRVVLQLSLGLNDTEPTDWSGEISLSAGRVVSVVPLGRAGRIEGNRWTTRTQRAAAKAKAKAKKKADPRVVPVELLVTLEAPSSATVTVQTPRGRSSVALADLPLGGSRVELQGALRLSHVTQTERLTQTDEDEDFPSCAQGPDGTLWCAYMSYRHGAAIAAEEVGKGKFDSLVPQGNGDQIRLVKLADNAFSAPMDVTEPGLDLWRPAVAVDGSGKVWVVWSQNNNGNWDLQTRRYDPASGSWSKVVRLTDGIGADLNPALARVGDKVWLAWQGWRNGNFDILLAELDDDGLVDEQRVSTSPANDWGPAIATSTKGELWIGWDTYDKGNYDVHVRRFMNERMEDPIAIAASPRFEARPSLAVDPQNRLWVAFEDSGPNWGKDYGERYPGKQGIPFYLERNINVRCVEAGQVRQPKEQPPSELMDSFFDDTRIPPTKHHRVSFPRLAVDGRGALWLWYRRHPLLNGAGERWVSFATRLEGDAWAPAVLVRDSANLMDNRPALVPLGEAALLAIHSTDDRTAGSPSAKANDLYATRIDVDRPAPQPALIAADPSSPHEQVEPIHPDEARDLTRIHNYRVRAGGRVYRLLRGEFHRHTEMSAHRDWDGPMEEIWRYALDVATMDWIGPGDHDAGSGIEYMWWLTQKQIDLYHLAPRFVPMFTYERSIAYPSGHRNVMFTRRGIRPLPRLEGQGRLMGTPEAGSPDIKNLYAYLKEFDGLCSSHTSATSMGTDWRDNDPALEPVVEIIQGHRQNYEEPGAPQAAHDAADSIQGFQPAGFVWQALRKGYRLGFQASSDHVSTHISYAIVLAEEPTREAIFAALKKRHSYAAQDNIILDVHSGQHLMGDEFTAPKRPSINLTAIGTAPIARVDIVRQIGQSTPTYVFSFEPNRAEVRFDWTDESARPGEVHMYYVRIAQADGKLAWSSPMWIRYQPE